MSSNCTIIVSWRPSNRPGTDDDRPGFERRRRAPERRRRMRTPKQPVQNNVAVHSDGTVRNDVSVPYNGVAAQPVRRHRRWAVGVATGPTRRQPSYRRRQGSTALCLLCCACCSALGDCFSSLCSSPFCVNSFWLLSPSPRCFTIPYP